MIIHHGIPIKFRSSLFADFLHLWFLAGYQKADILGVKFRFIRISRGIMLYNSKRYGDSSFLDFHNSSDLIIFQEGST